jgi:hypothetical protein
MDLSERLKDWTDFDGAEYELGIALGLFEDVRDPSFDKVPKWVFWSQNTLGNFLSDTLFGLADMGILERNEDGFRWSPEADNIVKKLTTSDLKEES